MLRVGVSSPLPSPQTAPLPLCPSSPSLCPELDLSLPLSPDPRTNPTHPKPKPQPHGESQHSNPAFPKTKIHAASQPQRKTHRQVHFEEPVVVRVTSEPSNHPSNDPAPQHSTRGHKGRGHRHGRSQGQRACPVAAVSNEEAVCVDVGVGLSDEAELNSTLALKAELESLQGAEFNSQKAVQQTLHRSIRTKNLINTKATEGVNVPPSQLLYNSLVSVSIQEHQLIAQALQDRLLAPPTRSHDNKSEACPSLHPFFSSELLRQKPLLLGEEPISKARLLPTPRSAHFTFDLYRRHTRWRATP